MNQIEQLYRMNVLLEWVATHQHRAHYVIGYSLPEDVFYVARQAVEDHRKPGPPKRLVGTFDSPVDAALDAHKRIMHSPLRKVDPPVELWFMRIGVLAHI